LKIYLIEAISNILGFEIHCKNLTPNENHLGTLSMNTASKLDVPMHEGNTPCVDNTQIGILKDSDEVCLSNFLEGEHSG
jgi:hypothetical protein